MRSRNIEEWKDVVWPRQLVHEEEALERKHRAKEAESSAGGQTYALLVGISKYQTLTEEEQLKYAHSDAAVFQQLLASPRGGGLTPDQMKVITNNDATTAAIRSAIRGFLARKAGRTDTIILFIAAHGVADERGAYIVTADTDPQDLAATALPMEEIQHLVDGEFANIGRVMIFVDVCHAGTIGTMYRRNMVNKVLETFANRSGPETFGLLASRPGEYSIESDRFGGGHGAFTYFLIRGLNGDADSNQDGEVMVDELSGYVTNQVREATRSHQVPREIGNMTGLTPLVQTISRPGIALADWQQLGTTTAAVRQVGSAAQQLSDASARVQSRGHDPLEDDLDEFESSLAAERILPETPGSAFYSLRRLENRLVDHPQQYFELENRLRVALQNRGQRVLLQYLQGDEVQQKRTDFESGELYFKAALELDPDAEGLQSRELFCRGREQIFEKKYPEAIDLLESAVRFDPTGAYTYNALGIAFLEQADYSRAVMAFRDAARRAPHWAYPLHNLALAYSESGDYESAIRMYERAIELAPRYSYLHYNLGYLYQRLNRRGDAELEYQRAIELTPQNAEPYNALGLLYASTGRLKKAEEYYRDALAKDPQFFAVRHNLALLLSKEPARMAEALDLWRRNVAEAPNFLPSRLSLAETLARQGQTAEAVQEYQEIVHLRSDYVSARLSLAQLYIRLGQNDDAIAELRAALALKPGSAAILEELGDVERSLGHEEDARAAYMAAVQASRDSRERKRIRQKLKGH